jgi:predicted patatin/cPLA2 family phospholipase
MNAPARCGSALVVEGGAMRGIFACGVLDVFMEQAFNPFDLAIGCSAGGCILASHLAGQRGRNLHCYMQHITCARK